MSTDDNVLSCYLAEEIVDNTRHSFYPAEDGHRCREKRTYYYKKGQKKENNRNYVVKTLKNIEPKIQAILENEEELKKHIYRFGEEGEFNRGQLFFRLSETGDEKGPFFIQTGNIIGSIRVPLYNHENTYIRLNIGSRFGEAFLRRLIASAEGFVRLDDKAGKEKERTNKNEIDYLLLLVWQIKMERALRKGLPKQYRQICEYTHTFRGTIDFNRYFNSPGILCPLPMRYPLLSHNNPVTQLLSLTTSIVSKKCGNTGSGFSTFPVWKNILTSIVDPLTIDQRRLKKAVIKNPYFHEYREVIHLSEMILHHAHLGIWGDRNDIDLFLFDISMLFEHYVRRKFKDQGYHIRPKDTAAHIPHGGRYNDGKRKLIPDIVIEKNNSAAVTAIFDVKYKRFDTKYGADREDLFQVISYASAFPDVETLGLIYPQDDGIQDRVIEKSIFLSGKEKKMLFLFIPTKDDEMDNFFKELTDILQCR